MRADFVATAIVVAALVGCAGLDFGEKGLMYYEPTPYLFVTVNNDCVSTASAVSLPGTQKWVQFDRGYGSADLSVSLANGVITAAGQKSDAKVPETLTAIGGLATALKPLRQDQSPKTICEPAAKMYPVKDGVPDLEHPMSFPVTTKLEIGGH